MSSQLVPSQLLSVVSSSTPPGIPAEVKTMSEYHFLPIHRLQHRSNDVFLSKFTNQERSIASNFEFAIAKFKPVGLVVDYYINPTAYPPAR